MIENEQTDLLRESWEATCFKYTSNAVIIAEEFTNIISRYQEPHRHYHNCQHILELLDLIMEYTAEEYHDIHIFTAFYHDVVYEPGYTDNEIKSAEFAVKSLEKLGVPVDIIQAVEEIILATQKHEWLGENIPNQLTIFLDIDRVILGAKPERFQEYCRQIRAEFSHFPDEIFIPARVSFLNGLIISEKIFFTSVISQVFENQLIDNVNNEILKFNTLGF